MKKALSILGALLLWLVLVSCGPSPTSVPVPAETGPRTASIPSAQGASPTATAAPEPTSPLSSTAEQELTELRQAARGAQGGFLFYLDAPGRQSSPQVYNVPTGQPFNAIALAGNYGVKDHDFVLVCLVDYMQAPCHERRGDKNYAFHLTSGQETRLELSLPLSTGAHDLLLLTFFDPASHSEDPVFRQDTRFLFAFHRVRLFAGSQAVPSMPAPVKFTTKDTLQPGASIFIITHGRFTDPSQPPWHRADVAPGEPLQFFAAYSNGENSAETVALVALLDYNQVRWDAERATFLAALEPGARADVPAALAAPSTAGPHELVVIEVDNPFLDLAGEVNANQPRSFFAQSSDRVLVLVR